MTDHHAACSCGPLTLAARGEPLRVSMCHCLACQRRTGSTCGAQVCFASADVAVAGVSTECVRIGDSGHPIRLHFCPTCGATVYDWFGDGGFRSVPMGAFADPTFAPPRVSVYEKRRHPWVGLHDAARRED